MELDDETIKYHDEHIHGASDISIHEKYYKYFYRYADESSLKMVYEDIINNPLTDCKIGMLNAVVDLLNTKFEGWRYR